MVAVPDIFGASLVPVAESLISLFGGDTIGTLREYGQSGELASGTVTPIVTDTQTAKVVIVDQDLTGQGGADGGRQTILISAKDFTGDLTARWTIQVNGDATERPMRFEITPVKPGPTVIYHQAVLLTGAAKP